LESGAARLLTATPSSVGADKKFEGKHQKHQQPITTPLPTVPAPSLTAGLVLPDEDELEMTSDEDPEVVRRHAVWPPSRATAQILASAAAATPGTFYPDRASLTAPAVILREDLVDPVVSLVVHYRGEQETVRRRAQVLTAGSVTQDQRGLRQLVRADCYRAAVNLTSRLLQMYNQGPGQGGSLTKHTPTSLQVRPCCHMLIADFCVPHYVQNALCFRYGMFVSLCWLSYVSFP